MQANGRIDRKGEKKDDLAKRKRYQTARPPSARTCPTLVAHAVARLYRIDHVDKRKSQFTVIGAKLGSARRGQAQAEDQTTRCSSRAAGIALPAPARALTSVRECRDTQQEPDMTQRLTGSWLVDWSSSPSWATRCRRETPKTTMMMRMTTTKSLPTSVQQHSGLLFSRLGRHEAHCRPHNRLADRFRIRSVVLVPATAGDCRAAGFRSSLRRRLVNRFRDGRYQTMARVRSPNPDHNSERLMFARVATSSASRFTAAQVLSS